MQFVKISHENRFDRGGEIRLMCECNGYCMVRRPSAIPFVMSRKDWNRLPESGEGAARWTVMYGIPIRDAS